MRTMNAILLDWQPKRMAHIHVATALFICLSVYNPKSLSVLHVLS